MITLDAYLPQGALCDADGALEAAISDSGALWWAGTALCTDAAGSVTAWPARGGGPTAVPTDPNTGHGQIGAAGDLDGLQCRDGVHCGMVAMDAAPDAAQVSLGLRYLPPWMGEAKTLLTLNTGGGPKKAAGQNYLYLSEAEGVLTLKDDAGLVTITMPAPPPEATRLVVFTLLGAQLSLAVIGPNGSVQTASATANAPVLTGAGHLFIGCRNQRPGLTKTLGGALIADVWLWPGRALLGQADPDLLALRRYWLWSGAA